eukprot:CCRYP_012545-RA/>CCRYP_012545-RA protein AED:0.13 eAED:0.13 QI:0/0.5/0.66/1/0/0/3/2309/96
MSRMTDWGDEVDRLWPWASARTISTDKAGVHMQYPSSFPHQHDPVRFCAGCPPCHVRSWPWVEVLLDRVYRKIVTRINSVDASRSFRLKTASTMVP